MLALLLIVMVLKLIGVKVINDVTVDSFVKAIFALISLFCCKSADIEAFSTNSS